MDISGTKHSEPECVCCNSEQECSCCHCQRYVSREKYKELQCQLKRKSERIVTLLKMLDSLEDLYSAELAKNYKTNSISKVSVAMQTSCSWWCPEFYWEKSAREAREFKPAQSHFTCQAATPSRTAFTQTRGSAEFITILCPLKKIKRTKFSSETDLERKDEN